MNALVLMLIPATIGVDFGWTRQPDNSIEYILQIEPEAVDSMKTGTELVSSLPPAMRNIKDYRIRVGRDPLPNQNKIPPDLTTPGIAQPNIPSNNYPANNYATTGNYPPASTGAYPAGTASTAYQPTGTYPQNGNYPQSGNSFVNNSTAPGYNPYSGTTASNTTGMSPMTGAPTVPTSTSGFPLQTTPANYTTNTTNSTLANLPPPPGSYPNNGYAPTPYPTGTATAPGYNPAYATTGYNPTGYNNTNPYNTTGYAPPGNFPPPSFPNQGYPNQQFQPTPNPYTYPQQPQYLAMNGGPLPAGYGAAKPTLNDPTGTASNFPAGTQFTPTGNTLGVPPPLNTNPLPGTNPSTLPPGGFTAGVPTTNGFVNNAGANTTGANNTDPHNPTVAANGQPTAKESQWASLGFALVALFASIGMNIYIFSQNHHLRERCRVLIADRAASY